MDEAKSNKTLKKLREALGNMTQMELAEKLYYSRRQSITDIETGKVPLWMKRAKALNDLLKKANLQFDDVYEDGENLPDDLAS